VNLRLTRKRLLSKKYSTTFLVMALSLSLAIFFTFKACMENYKNNLAEGSDKSVLVLGNSPDFMQIIQNSHFFNAGETSSFPIKLLREYEDFGEVIPVSNKFTAYEKPIVGLDRRYFRFKGLKVSEGEYFLKVGECVIGSECAKELNLSVGDSFVNDPSSSFDLSKSNPVKLKVCGILEKNSLPDDHTIFTNLKTTWVLEGIGHSHQPEEDDNVDSTITDLSSGPLEYLHFHGDENTYPLTGAILFPENDVTKAQLIAKSKNNKTSLTVVDPIEQIQQVFEKLAGIDSFFKLLFILMSISILLILGILIFQAASLRTKEKDTYFSLGIPKSFFYKSIFCEWILIIGLSISIASLITLIFKGLVLEIFSAIT